MILIALCILSNSFIAFKNLVLHIPVVTFSLKCGHSAHVRTIMEFFSCSRHKWIYFIACRRHCCISLLLQVVRIVFLRLRMKIFHTYSVGLYFNDYYCWCRHHFENLMKVHTLHVNHTGAVVVAQHTH